MPVNNADYECNLQKIVQALLTGREKKIDLIDFMRECSALFEKIEGGMHGGGRESAYQKLKELSGSVEGYIQDICRESGKNEEEINAYIENPDNFSQEVWLAIQRANRQILSGRESKRKKRR